MSVLSERLKQLRIDKSVTQKCIANHLGITEVSMQRFEYGTSRPKLDNLIVLADYFGVSLDYLVGRTDNPAINK